MAQNIGTLVSSAIRPNDSLDPIASAYAVEIKGGLHTSSTSGDRDAIIFERREWGMLCYVVSDNKTYQLTYGYSSTSIMNNLNWKEFSGSGSGSGTEWIDSVISISNTEPLSPVDGDRYILGNSPTGTNWSSISSYKVVQWNSSLSVWDSTTPSDGMSVRVDDEDNSIYRFEGIFGSGGLWEKEKLSQIRSLSATSSNSLDYTVTSDPPFDQYYNDMIFLTKFLIGNTGSSVTLDVNGLGPIGVKKVSTSGLVNLLPSDLRTDVVYSLTYDGVYFQLYKPSNEDLFNVKHYIEPNDYIVVPQYYQYWVYGNLEIAGTLINNGHVIIANGSLILTGGTFSNLGSLAIVSFSGGSTTSYVDSNTIQFSQSNSIYGSSVSAVVKDGSLTASKLDTASNGGATAGYILSVDNSGDFSWVESKGGLISALDKGYNITSNVLGDGGFTGLTISGTPVVGSYVGVFVNGQEFEVGYGSTTLTPFYFSGDGGTTARDNFSPTNIQIGDGLYWNSSVAGTGLYITWKLSLLYLI